MVQAAAALNHRLDLALKFRAPLLKHKKEPEISSGSLKDTSRALVDSDGAAPSAMPSSEPSLSCRLFSQVPKQDLTVTFQSQFSELQQEQLSEAGAQGRAMRHGKGTFVHLTVRQHSRRAVATAAWPYCADHKHTSAQVCACADIDTWLSAGEDAARDCGGRHRCAGLR